jgi:hypothetical protein
MPPADFGDRVDAIVLAELACQHVPGVQVGVAPDGTVVIDRGSRRPARGEPLGFAPGTHYAYGNTKRSTTRTAGASPTSTAIAKCGTTAVFRDSMRATASFPPIGWRSSRSLDGTGKIAGLFFRPAGLTPSTPVP